MLERLMGELDSALDISFEDLDEVLDDINTLIETRNVLQKATAGVESCSRNDQLHGPEEEP